MYSKHKPPIKLNINKPVISIFASGTSINKLSDRDISYIKSNTYTIGLNYAPCRINGLNQVFYLDSKVGSYLKKLEYDSIITTHYDRFLKEPFKNQYITDENAPEIFYNGSPWIRMRRFDLSIVTLIRMLREYYPDKKCLIFGLDLYSEGEMLKWYDKYIDEGRVKETVEKYGIITTVYSKKGDIDFEFTAYELDKISNAPLMGNLIFNANLNSKYEGFEKVEWKEFIETNK